MITRLARDGGDLCGQAIEFVEGGELHEVLNFRSAFAPISANTDGFAG